MQECSDILGVGFGPANIALAVALEESSPEVTAMFLEAQAQPVWQGGMMLPGSNIQNHPCRDLVTLRNPRSRYSFLNYLFEENRLVEHLNLAVEFPLRKEYAQYVSWVADQMRRYAAFGAKVAGVTLEEHGGEPVYALTTTDGARYLGRSLVFASGRTPYIPAPFDAVSSPRVFHLVDYLYRLSELAEPPRSVAVIGGSQSAVELTLDLAKRYPQARVVNYVRAFSLKLKDTSPFSEEGFFPAFTDYYYSVSRDSKRELDRYMHSTNYSSVDDDVLKELYLLIYEQRLDGDQRVFVRGNREVASLQARADGVALEIRERHTGAVEQDDVDLVVLATGFRDLGPGPEQEAYPRLLGGVIDRFRFDDDGFLHVNADYSLEPCAPGTPPLFLNGLCESSHGIGDAGSFSLLSLRAATILDGLLKRMSIGMVAG